MFKKVFFLTLFSVINIFCFNEKLYSKPLNNIEIAFYKENQWKFIENKLFIIPSEEINGIKTTLKTLAPGITFGGAITAILASTEILHRNDRPDEIVKDIAVGIITSIILMIPIHLVLEYKINLNTVFNFLENYNSDLNKLGKQNYKLYTPEKLHPFFDELSKDYQNNGKKFVIKRVSKLIGKIGADYKSYGVFHRHKITYK